MRLFDFPLMPVVVNGLRSHTLAKFNGQYLTSCTNGVPDADSFRSSIYPDRTVDISADEGGDYIPSRLFYTSAGAICVQPNAVYNLTPGYPVIMGSGGFSGVGNSPSPVTYTRIPLTNNSAGPWSCADFTYFIVLMSPDCTIIRGYNGSNDFVIHDGSLVPQMNCICNANGRAVLGGVGGYIQWSSIGQMKFLDRGELMEGNTDTVNRNEAGFIIVSHLGDIKAVYNLESKVIILGEGGITALTPATVEPSAYATFGRKDLSFVGVKNGYASIKTPLGVFYVNSRNYLCLITWDNSVIHPQMKYVELGFFELLDSATANLSFDERKGELYINHGGTTTYLFSKGKMGEIDIKLDGLVYHSIEDELIALSDTAIPDSGMEFTTDILDFNYPGTKTIMDIKVFGDYINTSTRMEFSVDYSLDEGGTFTSSSWKPVNNQGVADIRISGVKFKVKCRQQNPLSTTLIQNIEVGIQTTDKRFKRGIKVGVNTVGNQTTT